MISKMISLLNVQDFLLKAVRGETNLSPNYLELFKNECEESLKKQMSRKEEGFRIRMSGLGRPLCQLIAERDGVEQEMDYNSLLRFLFGDITEAIMMYVLRESGINIVEAQKPVSLELDGHLINGTLDVIIEDELGQKKVWDIKSSSEWAFRYKYKQGYDAMKESDLFGYLMQGHLYAEATGLLFGGWIVINKSSGEILFVEAPEWQDEDRAYYLKEAREKIKALTDPSTKIKKYEPQFEIHKKEKTGNKLLPKECSLCSFRNHCWPDAILYDKVTSAAKNPQKVWYTTLKKTEV
jgi:hypothetical protein|tara:strand:+ start:6420 stop:7304 length:885 start_codon:yes stop_codon:yes gene_type:complete